MIKISKKYLGVKINECKFLGQGREGKVYLTLQGEVLKIFKNKKKCAREYRLLNKVHGIKYFPKVIKKDGKCMLREYVGGVPLEEYIKKNGITKNLSNNLVNLIEKFKRLGFKRLDMAIRHIYVQNDEDIKVIDPRKVYSKNVKCPNILLKELEHLGVVDEFIKMVFEIKPNIAVKWLNYINHHKYKKEE